MSLIIKTLGTQIKKAAGNIGVGVVWKNDSND